MTLVAQRERRVLAIFLPEILCEIARRHQRICLSEGASKPEPMAVILVRCSSEKISQDRLTAVCPRAFCAGVRPGQTTAEATALLAGLKITIVESSDVERRLLAIAEVVAQYGPTLSWDAQLHADTVWLDISGAGHLYGGERSLCEELAEHVRLLGHRVRVAVAAGPQIAQAVARFGHAAIQIIDSDALAGARALADLPLAALPLEQELIFWFGRLGIFQVGQLAQLPAAAASSRLGPSALSLLQLVQGIDPKPLVPGAFPRSLFEESLWEEPAEGLSPLLFALHGIVSRLSSRLRGRGEAGSSIECELIHDSMIARHLQVSEHTLITFELASPLYQEADLERVVRARLEACELLAPTVGIKMRIGQLTAQAQHQLGLSSKEQRSLQSAGPWSQEFPVLIAELQSDIGSKHVGTLVLSASHIPEECSSFQPLLANKEQTKSKQAKGRTPARRSSKLSQSSTIRTLVDNPSLTFHKLGLCPDVALLTRLLPYPQQIKVPMRAGETFALGGELYAIVDLRFVRRLTCAKWWQETSINRDYHWAWLRSAQGGTEALLFVDRKTGEGFVQALRD